MTQAGARFSRQPGMILYIIPSCGNTGSIRDDPYWTFGKKRLELIEIYSINKTDLVQVKFQ